MMTRLRHVLPSTVSVIVILGAMLIAYTLQNGSIAGEYYPSPLPSIEVVRVDQTVSRVSVELQNNMLYPVTGELSANLFEPGSDDLVFVIEPMQFGPIGSRQSRVVSFPVPATLPQNLQISTSVTETYGEPGLLEFLAPGNTQDFYLSDFGEGSLTVGYAPSDTEDAQGLITATFSFTNSDMVEHDYRYVLTISPVRSVGEKLVVENPVYTSDFEYFKLEGMERGTFTREELVPLDGGDYTVAVWLQIAAPHENQAVYQHLEQFVGSELVSVSE